jgi:dihydrofolate reductase
MAALTITMFLSLDGVVQGPGAPQEDTSGGFRLGGWVVPHDDDDLSTFIVGTFRRAEAFLLGRETYQIWAGHWPRFTDPADPIASALNRLPKYVASRTLAEVEWAGSSLVRSPIAELDALKARHRGELQVHGSAGLARSLLAAGVVDELNLMTFPVVLGRGKRLFHGDAAPAGYSLIEGRISSKGVAIARYRRAGEVAVGSFALDP